MKLLFISPFPHWPGAGHGGSVAGWAQIDVLRRQHDVAIVSFSETGPFALTDPEDVTAFYREEGVQHWLVPVTVSKWDLRLARVRAVFSGWPEAAEVSRSTQMSAQIRRSIAAFDPHAVIVQFPQMAHYVDACVPIPTFMDVQDVASVSAFRAIEFGRTIRARFRRAVNWLRWVRYERFFYRQFHGVITLTEQDRQGVTVFSPQVRVQSLGLPVTIPTIQANIPLARAIRFVGNFNHAPNAEGLRFFINRVWPQVRKHRPNATLEIGGRNLPIDLRGRTSEGIRDVGFVADLPQFLATATAVVVPLVSGGGVKVKTLEALAAGAAVVTTSIGAEGISGEDGVHFFRTDDPLEMAERLVFLLDRPDESRSMRAEAIALIERDWSPDAWAERFTSFVGSDTKTAATAANELP
jgi:glycosyltransferase involved in cell wall biosynthesis